MQLLVGYEKLKGIQNDSVRNCQRECESMNQHDQEERNQKENDELSFENLYLRYKEHLSRDIKNIEIEQKGKLFFNIPSLISWETKGK